ncbi:MAG TPA: hypothetical protein VGM73_16280 [Candidatus Didemnitutus sp.]|jgi:hypothetical protein
MNEDDKIKAVFDLVVNLANASATVASQLAAFRSRATASSRMIEELIETLSVDPKQKTELLQKFVALQKEELKQALLEVEDISPAIAARFQEITDRSLPESMNEADAESGQ